ncbi:hypothetical protein DFAR_710026 [Desulfarculales bacterium]
MGGQGNADGELHHLLVQHRQHSGHAHAHWAGVLVGWGPKLGGAAAEYLGIGQKLGMHLQPDDSFVLHSSLPVPSRWQMFKYFLNLPAESDEVKEGRALGGDRARPTRRSLARPAPLLLAERPRRPGKRRYSCPTGRPASRL